MNKYIDADKLKERVTRLIASARQNDWPIAEDYLRRVIDTIDSLQQEQPEVDLDDVIEDYVLENFGERWDGCVPVSCFELNMMANHFYKLGRFNARKEE